MKVSTRFSIAVHAIALIHDEGGKPVSSSLIAGSVNTNPVIIRRILAMLKEADLITVLRGPQGSLLKKSIDDITLYDVFAAVNSLEDESLFDFHDNPNPNCYIGANIQQALEVFLIKSQTAMESVLKEVSIRDVFNKIPK